MLRLKRVGRKAKMSLSQNGNGKIAMKASAGAHQGKKKIYKTKQIEKRKLTKQNKTKQNILKIKSSSF